MIETGRYIRYYDNTRNTSTGKISCYVGEGEYYVKTDTGQIVLVSCIDIIEII